MAKLQGEQDRKTLELQLANSRTTTKNAFGTSGWKNNKTFDQAGFDAAMAKYNTAPAAPQGRWMMDTSSDDARQIWVPGEVAATGTTGQAPNRADFEGKDNWINEQVMSPDSQGVYDTATQKLNAAMGNISTDPHAYNQEVADAIQRRMTRYLAPQQQQERSAMQSNLADRGFQVGNEGYINEMTRMDNNQSMANADIADRAQITGASQGLAEQSMQQQIAAAMQSMRERQVAGVSGMPTTTATPNMQPYDISGAMMQNYGDQLDAYNAQQANSSNLLGSLLGAGVGLATGGAGSLFAGMSGALKAPKTSYANPNIYQMGNY